MREEGRLMPLLGRCNFAWLVVISGAAAGCAVARIGGGRIPAALGQRADTTLDAREVYRAELLGASFRDRERAR